MLLLSLFVSASLAFPSQIDPAIKQLAVASSQLFGTAVKNQAASCNNQCPFLLRQAHVKQHGCLTGTLFVHKNLPSNLAVGLFNVTEQGASSFPVIARFSNGKGNGFAPGYSIGSDTGLDARGFAVKVFNVKGPKVVEPTATTSDFIAISSNVLFMDDTDSQIALPFFQASEANSSLSYGAFLIQHPIMAARLAKFALSGRIQQLQLANFYTVAPLTLGSTPVKYKFSACSTNQVLPVPDTTSDNYLRENLKTYFDIQGLSACWDVSVQLFVDDNTTPLNDLSQPWNVPWVPMATLELDAQAFGSVVQEAMCSNIAFHPYRTLASNAPPVDSWVQYIRNTVYGVEQKLRRTINGLGTADWNITEFNNYVSAAP